MSRVAPEWECWAIFEGTAVELVSQRAIKLEDAALRHVADCWSLRVF